MEAVRIRVNAPQVIHESIDGEVIIIDLTSGSYFSTKGSGAEIWEVINASPGLSLGELTDAVLQSFDAVQEDAGASIEAFVDRLQEEGLVVDAGQDAGVTVTVRPVAEGGARQPFAAPVLDKYTDMQDLVLIDPVHQVDATGWPQARPEEVATQDANA
jgi:hypothetical protein